VMRRWPLLLLLLAAPLRADTSAIEPEDGKVTEGTFPLGPCISPADQARLEKIVAALPRRQHGTESTETVLFAAPMGGGGTGSLGKQILQYVDLDPSVGGILDYNCGTTTYDGHGGIDTTIPTFYEMDEGVPV